MRYSLRWSLRKNRAVMAMLSAIALGVGFGYASAAPQPATNAEAAKVAASTEPGSPVYVMSDMTRTLESVDHQALVDAGMLVLADYLPPYVTPYSKTKDASRPDGVRFRPDLCTLGKPDKPFFYVMPGGIDSIINENGVQVPDATLKGLQMWVAAMDGDGRKASGTVFALRMQMPDGMWKPWEVRGYVYVVQGDETEWVDLGQVDFRVGGKAAQLGFEFKEVTWNANHTTVHMSAISDPRVWMVRCEVALGDESKTLRSQSASGFSPAQHISENLAAKLAFTTAEIATNIPSTAHVKAEVLKNARLVRVPFVFRTGPDDMDAPALIPQSKPAKATMPNYVMSTSVKVFGDAPPPAPPKAAPAVVPAPPAKPAVAAKPASKPAPAAAAVPAPKPRPAPVVKHAPNLPTVPADLIASFVHGNLPKPPAPPAAPTVTTYKLDPDPPSPAARVIKAPEPAPPAAPKQAEVKPVAPPAPAAAVEAPPEPPMVLPTAEVTAPDPTPAPPAEKTTDKKGYKVRDKFGSDELPEAGQPAN